MELKLTVSYQPRIITNPVRYDSKMNNILTNNEKFAYDAEFWREYKDKFYLESDALLDSFMWHLDDIIGPVVDTNVIDMGLRELLHFDSKFDKNTYAVQFEAIVRFASYKNNESNDLYVHKHRLTDLIVEWLTDDGIYRNHAFISAGDDDLNATFGNVTVYYKIEVEREDVDVSIEVRK